jgi:hypothetical protein
MTTHAMTGFDTGFRRDLPTAKARTGRRALLLCGVVSSLYYAGVTAYVTSQAAGYSSLSQAVSELSAIDAPTRPLWIALGVPYTLLLIAFGWGVWLSAGPSRALRAVGALYVAEALIGAFWPPMHLRGTVTTLTDTLHIAWTGGWLAVMLTGMGLSAAVLGRRFRLYTLATLAVFVGFGVLTSIEGVRLAADLPTPYLGLWERINMGAGMLWIAVLALTLLSRDASLAAYEPEASHEQILS